jgi:hypothetical protein
LLDSKPAFSKDLGCHDLTLELPQRVINNYYTAALPQRNGQKNGQKREIDRFLNDVVAPRRNTWSSPRWRWPGE